MYPVTVVLNHRIRFSQPRLKPRGPVLAPLVFQNLHDLSQGRVGLYRFEDCDSNLHDLQRTDGSADVDVATPSLEQIAL